MDLNMNLKGLTTFSSKKRSHPILNAALGLFGLALIVMAVWLAFSDWRTSGEVEQAEAEKSGALEEMAQPIRSLKQVLADRQVQELALRAIRDPEKTGDLFAYLNGRITPIDRVDVYPADTTRLDATAMGENAFAVMDMVLSALEGKVGLMQYHQVLDPPRIFDAVTVESDGEMMGVLVVSLDPQFLLSGLNPEYGKVGAIRLSQYNGRQKPNHLQSWGDGSRLASDSEQVPLPGTRFRVEFPKASHIGLISGFSMLLVLAAGILCMASAVWLFQRNRKWEALHERREEKNKARIAVRKAAQADTPAQDAQFENQQTAAAPAPAPDESGEATKEPPAPAVDLPDPPPLRLKYNLAEQRRHREAQHAPIELDPGIFRAYDIRGVIDKTLDSGVARNIGRAVGTLALERNAAPVVVARDGRLSGPYLMQGMIEGITSTGCDVLDIGGVPTGVLYYAAHELAEGSGVMITGSHNPPDYNGFKVMIGGDTLHGDAIKAIYERIVDGDFKVGEGSITRRDVVKDYIKRIADDIEVERDMKVVIDCGNGIGGVCAADAIRALGVEVLPLFDEVDGTFPNHHPDPSDPENLVDLIESVRLMDADLGLAFDGDADRLGVVTLAGDIIYPDRIMMLLALDVLDRNPGATIIYDVKCTGHLPRVIREAGGNPVMYKTGHSLIKAYMKEIGAPFAGEMSGHFFFGERWYGVDDGIYAAARLLEILGGTEAPPEAILNALPSSYSTPELKVQMEEGENHAFIEAFKAASQFDEAQISTIDGIRADYRDGWGLVRASNTTPILVVRFDAETEEALTRIKANFRSQMLAVNPNLDLPF